MIYCSPLTRYEYVLIKYFVIKGYNDSKCDNSNNSISIYARQSDNCVPIGDNSYKTVCYDNNNLLQLHFN